MQTGVDQERQSGNEAPDQRELARTGLEDLEPQSEQILDAIPQHIFIWDGSGALLYANKMALDYYGATLENCRSEDLRARVCHPEDMAALTEAINRSRAHRIQ